MTTARAGVRRRVAAVCAAAVAACLLLAPALVAATAGSDPAALDRTVRFLQAMQNEDGGFGSNPGSASDPGISAWVAIALAAAGVNPFDQARPGGSDAATYVLRNTRFRVTTDYERAALVAIAAGIPLRDFHGTDLIAAILRAQRTDGSFAHGDVTGDAIGGINDTAFAIFALGGVEEAAVKDAVQRAADWLLTVQNRDGGWEFALADPVSSVDITGAVIQALRHAGRRGSQAEQRALGYLRAMQQDDGGFPYSTAHADTNTASTAWAVQGLWAAGVDPSSWEKGGSDPLDYLRAMQLPSGEILWKAGPEGGTNTIWMTAYAAPAYAGMTWPPPAVPRRTTPEPEPPADPAPPGGDGREPGGAGGTSPDGGGQVIAGGGGNGAPLFSRPQPQSRGSTPGGVRRTRPRRRPEPRRRERPHDSVTPPRQEITGTPAERATGEHGAPSAAAPAERATGGRGVPRPDAGGRARPAADGDGPSGGGGTEVRGRVIADPAAPAEPADVVRAAAPGLRSARRGGGDAGRAVAIGIAGGIVLAGALGVAVERRRPRLRSLTAPSAIGGTA